MREIKFRGYSIDDKCWVTGYGVEKITEDGFFIPTGCANDTYEVFKESIGEYTGIKDINGVEIYEGDIVRSTREQNVYIGVVAWFEVGWYIHTKLTCIKKDGIKYKYPDYIRLTPRFSSCINEVIGNIYENPELLEGE